MNFPSPNIKPKPKSQNSGVPIQKSIMFFMIMLPAFFARVKPVSTIAKPACIKNTSAAPNSTHIVLTALKPVLSANTVTVFVISFSS